MTKTPKASKANGAIKYIAVAATILGTVMVLGKLVWSAASQASCIETTTHRVDVIEPKVEELSKHKISSEINLAHIEEKVDAIDGRLDGMDTKQTQILTAIKALTSD